MHLAFALSLLGIFFTAHAVAQLSCDQFTPSKTMIWPPNGKFENITVMGGSPRTTKIVVTAVKQDEDPGTDPKRGSSGLFGRLFNFGNGNALGFFKSLFRRQPAPAPPVGNSTNVAPRPAGAPDALIDSDVASLRRERDGVGDGRVYHIYFNATDTNTNATCSGEVTVCVPQNQGNQENACVDSSLVSGGQLYNSIPAEVRIMLRH